MKAMKFGGVTFFSLFDYGIGLKTSETNEENGQKRAVGYIAASFAKFESATKHCLLGSEEEPPSFWY